MVFPTALAVTILVEVPVVVVLAAALRVAPWRRAAGAAAVASLLTLPLLWFVLVPLLEPALGWVGAVLVGEALVVAAEVAVYSRLLGCDLPAALGLSLAANAASVLVGLALGA